MKKILSLIDLDDFSLDLTLPSLIFLRGDLGAGKTTLTKHFLKNIGVTAEITSPTYTYYNKYEAVIAGKKVPVYHFDLYRIGSYEEFFAIAGEEILDNNEGIILVEWPDYLESVYEPDVEIVLEKTEDPDKRSVEIRYKVS